MSDKDLRLSPENALGDLFMKTYGAKDPLRDGDGELKRKYIKSEIRTVPGPAACEHDYQPLRTMSRTIVPGRPLPSYTDHFECFYCKKCADYVEVKVQR